VKCDDNYGEKGEDEEDYDDEEEGGDNDEYV
jgi:hypothetical protein